MSQSKKASRADAASGAGARVSASKGKDKSQDKSQDKSHAKNHAKSKIQSEIQSKILVSGQSSSQPSPSQLSSQSSPSQHSSQPSSSHLPSSQPSSKSGGANSYDRISYNKSWRKIELKPARDSSPENLLAADRLLRLLNASYFQIGGREWQCKAKIVLSKIVPTKDAKESSSETSSQIQKQPQAIVIACGGANYLLEAAMPVALRQAIEKMTEPFQIEEIPQAIALGVISFKLKPSLQQLLALSAKVKDYFFATTTNDKTGDKTGYKVADKNKDKWLQQCDLAIDIIALPIEDEKAEDGKQEPQELQPKQQQNNSRMPFEFRLHLAYANALELCAILQPTRSIRHYPPNLHINWNFYTTPTTISLQELRDLEEGDVLLLA